MKNKCKKVKKPENGCEKAEKRPTAVRRLLWLNLFALVLLLFVSVTALWALGLLGSILKFIF